MGANVAVSGRREREGKETIGLIRAAEGDGLFVRSLRATSTLDSATPQGFEIVSTGGAAVGPDSTSVNNSIRNPSPRLDGTSRSSTQNQ